jgi:hypothetical protein
MKRTAILIGLFLLGTALSGFASLQKITIFVWCELEPLTGETHDGELLSKEEAAKRVLEEARIVISAMIYGYEFIYTPSDEKRKVKELFSLTPTSEIRWGDPGLKIEQAEVEEKRLFATVGYTLDDSQAARIAAWSSAAIPTDAGIGDSSVYAGQRERLVSFKNSIKEAIRNYMRQRIFNKPRELAGQVLLTKSPSVVIKAGRYFTTSNVKINMKKVLPYKGY